MKGKAGWAVPGVIGVGLAIWQLVPVQGWLGHDFYHYLTRIYLGAIHFWQNGLAVPHYTPALCGGMPLFADPQSMYYSVPQWLSFWMDPMAAVLVTHLIFFSLGYWGCYRFLRIADAGPVTAHWGSLAFILNGFSFEHLLVGHMTHHTYLLLPWLLYLALASVSFGRRVGLFSLILAYTFYSGGTHMMVVFAAAGLILLPWLTDRKAREGKLRETALWLGASAVLVLAACAPKLAASASFSPSFLQRPVDSSRLSMATLLFQFFWFDPRQVPLTLTFGKWHFGPWEYVGFVSRLLMPAVPLLILVQCFRMDGRRLRLCLATFASVYAVAWVGAARHAQMGLWLLSGYHNPIKVFGAFIPFLILAAVVVVVEISRVPRLRVTTPWVRVTLFGIAAFLVVFEFWVGSRYFVTNRLVYGPQYQPQIYRELKARGRLPEVKRVEQKYGADIEGIRQGFTSSYCFEPMFGYRREVMKATVAVGPTTAVRDGRFNLTHPGCLLYPRHFHCQRWDRIPESESASLRKFVAGEAGAFEVPPWQTGLLRLGLVAWIVLLLLCLGAGEAWALARRPKTAEEPA